MCAYKEKLSDALFSVQSVESSFESRSPRDDYYKELNSTFNQKSKITKNQNGTTQIRLFPYIYF